MKFSQLGLIIGILLIGYVIGLSYKLNIQEIKNNINNKTTVTTVVTVTPIIKQDIDLSINESYKKTVRLLAETDNEAFVIAADSLRMCGKAVIEVSDGDYSNLSSYTAKLNDNNAKMDILTQQHTELITELGL